MNIFSKSLPIFYPIQQKHAEDTFFLTFLLYRLTISTIQAANIVRPPCSDSSHVTAPYKLSFIIIIIIIIIICPR